MNRTYRVPVKFDQWPITLEVDATVTVDRDDDPDCGTLITVENIDIHTTDAALLACIVAEWGEEFPDTPCPITLADVAAKDAEIRETIADAVMNLPLDD